MATPAKLGGRAARQKTGPLWKFTGNDGSFILPDPDYIGDLYFPLFNIAGMKSYVTPELKGDICKGFNEYLTIPSVTEDFHLSKASRNFWVSVEGKEPWSATGVSAAATAAKWKSIEPASIEAGIGWFKTIRKNKKMNLSASTTVFVPSAPDMVEVMLVEIENTGKDAVTFVATPASPIFGRSADNVRDHRQVTSMFSEIDVVTHGVIVKGRIHHDEHGHRPNKTSYTTLAFGQNGEAPNEIWSNERVFIGDGGTLDNPEAVALNLTAPKVGDYIKDGVEAIAAMRFSPITLGAGEKRAFVILRCIAEDRTLFDTWSAKYGTQEKAQTALEATKAFWRNISDEVSFTTENKDFDNIIRWINFQPFCRKVYGNSYLPDHDYGRGGRGWRDLWSDLAALFLVDPSNTREEIVNSLMGIRVDGSNATIIGTKAGEFVADRNNVVRTWADHGTWPFFILKFYMDQTGDYDILKEEITYWKDAFAGRCKMRDSQWSDADGNTQKDEAGNVYKGSIFEHVLLQQISMFFNVGEHNNILLEGGDWNDTYDMGRKRGETVCFSNWFSWNLKTMAEMLEGFDRQGMKEIHLAEEIVTLLDTLPGQQKTEYSSPQAKQARLKEYFERVKHTVSGKKSAFNALELAADLRAKAEFITNHIRTQEFITTNDGERFFNGHYDDNSRRVHGDHPNGVRMDLTSQVLPIMFGIATDEQVKECYKAIRRYLRHPETGALRLCSDFKELKLDFGRVTGFTFGWRENGSVWSQQNAMLAYGLYTRGFVNEGWEVFQELYRLCADSGRAKIFPNLPSCWRNDGKGLSSYLTGAATWLMVAVVNHMFGIRGDHGNLVINPKLVKEQFGKKGRIQMTCNFLGQKLRVDFINKKLLDWNEYSITGLTVNGTALLRQDSDTEIVRTIPKDEFLRLCNRPVNEISVELG